MTGWVFLAVKPISELSSGTALKPSKDCPSSLTILAKASLQNLRSLKLAGRKTSPEPYPPRSGSRILAWWAILRKNWCGVWISIPAPSPVLGSAPVAPRWESRLRTFSPCRTMILDFLPLTSQINPTPQESCSKRES